MAVGIRQRHGRACSAKGRCKCPWEAFVYSKRDEKKIRKSFPTKAAAVAWRDDASTAVRKKTMRATTPMTLSEAAQVWLDGARAGTILPRSKKPYKPATIRGYERSLRLHILPELGYRKLSEIEHEELQGFVNTLITKGHSPGLISCVIGPVRCIFRYALKQKGWGIAINPTTGLDLPADDGRRERVAPPEECAKLLGALARDRALWATAMYSGLRRGELQALRVENIDLAAGLIYVNYGWDQYEGEIETKNHERRKVPIAGRLRDYLDEHLLGLQWRERPDGLVFGVGARKPFVPMSVGDRANWAWGWKQVRNPVLKLDPDAKPQKVWIKARTDALERITPHECRHTYASLMIEAMKEAKAFNPKALSTYMGHADISITYDRYGHLFPGNEEEAAGLLDSYLDRADTAARLAQVAA
jgi:integrase